VIIFQKIYKREDAQRNYAAGNPVLYVFGDNIGRYGYAGQAGEMRDEPNAVGVATLYKPGVYFIEEATATESQKRVLDVDMKPLFEHVKNGGIIIWPADGIGTGFAHMPENAPSTFAYLEEKFAALLQVARLWNAARYEAAAKIADEHISRAK